MKHAHFYRFRIALICFAAAWLLECTLFSASRIATFFSDGAFYPASQTLTVTRLQHSAYSRLDSGIEQHCKNTVFLTQSDDPADGEKLQKLLLPSYETPDAKNILFHDADFMVVKCADLPQSLRSIRIEADFCDPAQKLQIFAFYGNADELPASTGMYTATAQQPIQYIPFLTSDHSQSLYISLMGSGVESVRFCLNPVIPFQPALWRVGLVWLILSALVLLQKKNASAHPVLSDLPVLWPLPMVLAGLWALLPEIMILVYPLHYLLTGSSWHADLYAALTNVIGQLCLCYAVYCLIFRRKSGRRPRFSQSPWYYLLAMLMIWIVVCTAASGHFFELFRGMRYHYEGVKMYFQYAALFVCVCQIPGEKRRMALLQIFALAADGMAVLMLVQRWCYRLADLILSVYPNVLSGVFFNINHCGYFLTVTAVCLFGLILYEENQKLRMVYLLSLELQFFALVLNNTFGCFLAVLLAVAVCYVFYFASGRRYHYRLLLPALLLLAVCAAEFEVIRSNFTKLNRDVANLLKDPNSKESDRAGSGRFILWKYAFSQMMSHPILGCGADGMAYGRPEEITLMRPHNEFLEYGAFFGLPGLGLYLAAFVTLAVRCIQKLASLSVSTLIAAGAVIAYQISAFFGVSMFYTAPFLFLLLAVVCVGVQEAETPAVPEASVSRSQKKRTVSAG